MSEYIIEFSKTGTICYTSHLDLMRIFKRVFKRTGVALAYSQGFNPHPKMGFAQPLSLGYWGMAEYFECETAEEWAPDQLLQKLAQGMPEGIELKQCLPAENLTKTLASHTVAAEYMIAIPMEPEDGGEASGSEAAGSTGTQAAESEAAGSTGTQAAEPETAGSTGTQAAGAEAAGSTGTQAAGAGETGSPQAGEPAVEQDPDADLSDPRILWHSYMGQDEILVWKRQKKKKEPKLVDIKPMIREITFTPAGESGTLYVQTVLDCGSGSNLSPELIISSVCRRFGIGTDRSEISVMRRKILFDRSLQELLADSR